MGWSAATTKVAIPAIASIGGALINARSNSSSSRNATNATNASSAEALAEQKRIFDLQRQDQLAARARRLAVAGDRRQLIMGDDGKMTLGPQMKTLGDYSVSGINPPAMPPGPVNQNFTGTPLGGFGGGYDDGNKSLGSDANAVGSFGQITPNHPTAEDPYVDMINPTNNQRARIPRASVSALTAQGWMPVWAGQQNGGGR